MASVTAPQNMEEFQGGHSGSDDVSVLKDLMHSAQQDFSASNPILPTSHAAMHGEDSMANHNNLHGVFSGLADGSGAPPSVLHADMVRSGESSRDAPSGSVWSRLNFGEVNIMKNPKAQSRVSYASVVQASSSNNSSRLDFFDPKEKSSTMVDLPIALTSKTAALYQDTLYGYFLGPRPYFPSVKKVVHSIWGKFGLKDVMMNDAGFLFFRFSNADGMRQVTEGGPG